MTMAGSFDDLTVKVPDGFFAEKTEEVVEKSTEKNS